MMRDNIQCSFKDFFGSFIIMSDFLLKDSVLDPYIDVSLPITLFI